jgi:hypothetical protein
VYVCCLLTELRGVGGDVIIMEEAAFMSSEMFAKIVVPLFGVAKTAVLAISTPDDEFNYYTNLMDIKLDGGKSLFKVIRIGGACDSCSSAGIKCTHSMLRLPIWKPLARQEKIDLIMKTMPEL